MASFSDYLKENDLLKKINNVKNDDVKVNDVKIDKGAKARNELDEQICTIKKNIDLRIEELKCAKDYFKLYDYLYILISLRKAHDYLTEAQDTINGWLPVYEEELPEDEIFEGENNDEN